MNDIVPLNTILSEIATIEQDMVTDRRAYFRDEEKQARYRSLVARKAQYSAAQPTVLSEGIHVYSAQEFAREHGTTEGYNGYLRTVREASDVLFGIPAGEQSAFVRSFENLPDSVVLVALGELNSAKFNAGYSDSEDVDSFARLPEGAILVREWGADAQRKHATVKARLIRACEAMEDDEDVGIFLDWHEGLSTGAKIALYRKLVA
jgi:hypothetical protein